LSKNLLNKVFLDVIGNFSPEKEAFNHQKRWESKAKKDCWRNVVVLIVLLKYHDKCNGVIERAGKGYTSAYLKYNLSRLKCILSLLLLYGFVYQYIIDVYILVIFFYSSKRFRRLFKQCLNNF